MICAGKAGVCFNVHPASCMNVWEAFLLFCKILAGARGLEFMDDNINNMTYHEAMTRIECYREIFSEVRLLDEEMLISLEKGERPEGLDGVCSRLISEECDDPCISCPSVRAYREKKQVCNMEVTADKLYHITARYVKIDGKPYVMELVKYLDDDLSGQFYERELVEEKLTSYNKKLYTDVLTGAYNRRYFEDEIKQKSIYAGVALIDIDDFKLCNDTYGHNAGDRALTVFVSVIRKCIRKTDILLRYGGDEFILIIPGVNADIFSQKLHQIQQMIQDASVPDYPRMQMSVSIGGVIASGEMIGDAVYRADRLMYMAKAERNMVVIEGESISDQEHSDGTLQRNSMKQQILIVDDSDFNRQILVEMLQSDFRILEAANGEECISLLEQYGTGISLVMLDIVMPVLDGFSVLAYMNRKHWIEDIPVIMISSEESSLHIQRAYEMGVSDYISRPFDAKVVYQRVYNTIKLYMKQRRLIKLVSDQVYEKEKNNRIMVSILSQIVEFRNGESGLHVLNINLVSALILERLVQKTDVYKLSWARQYMISTASALHDIGKIGIDEKILNKPGKLTDEEYEIMKTHSMIGYEMLNSIELYQNEELLKIAKDICRWHHESYDGRGYPDGLKGEEIPISAQVVSMADVYDALVSERVYKKAFTHEQAVKMIINGECGVFNPLLIECLVDIQDELADVYKRNISASDT